MVLKAAEERREAAEKMTREARQIAALFSPATASFSSPKTLAVAENAIISLAELVKSDLEMLSLEFHTLIKKYPDFTQDQLVCLLSLRGDVGWVKQTVTDLFADCVRDQISQPQSTIFSQIIATG